MSHEGAGGRLTLSILNPRPGQTVEGIVTVRVAHDVTTHYHVDTQRRGTSVSAVSTFEFHTTNFPDGPHVLTITTNDGLTASVDVVVKNTPESPPPVVSQPEPLWRKAGAMIVNASSAPKDELHRLGFRLACPMIHQGAGQDSTTEANLREFAAGWVGAYRSAGYTVGGWGTSHHQPEQEASVAADLVRDHGLAFYIADIEAHKADLPGGSLELTERLLAALRTRLGPDFPIGCVTFGIHSSPAVVNFAAMQKQRAVYLAECYDGEANTLGVRQTLNKAAENGEPTERVKPVLGGKQLAADSGELPAAGVKGLWAWQAENALADPVGAEALRQAILAGAAEL